MALSNEERIALINEAHALLDRINLLLNEAFERCSARVKWLKANAGNLSPEDQALLDAQLAHEAKMAGEIVT